MNRAVQAKLDDMWPVARWGIGVTVPIICACIGWLYTTVNTHETHLRVHDTEIQNMNTRSEIRKADDQRQMDEMKSLLKEMNADLKELLKNSRN